MSKEITLSKPVDIDGAPVKVLRMREPNVEDQLTAEEAHKSQARQEVTLFANLCEVPADAIGRLSLKDYRKLQEAYADFL